MVDAQNERTTGRNRRRGRRRKGGKKPDEIEQQQLFQQPELQRAPETASASQQPVSAPVAAADAPVVRPADIEPPTVRSEEYCVYHMATFRECEPMEIRTNMTTLRHLRVDHFGEATLFCDCLHNGPHEWPPTMQKLETAVELDQFLADSTSEA